MNEQLAYIFTIDSYILQNSNNKIADIFITKHKEGLKYYCGSDMERFRFYFETALSVIGEWQIQASAITYHHDENKVMEYFTAMPSNEAGKLADSILLFSDVFATKGVNEVITYCLNTESII